MLKKLFIILFCISFFVIPVLAQQPYQDLMDQIQARNPSGIPDMPIMTPNKSEQKPIVNSKNPSLILNQTFETFPSKNINVNVYHHYDSPDPYIQIMHMLETPPVKPIELGPKDPWIQYPIDPFYGFPPFINHDNR